MPSPCKWFHRRIANPPKLRSIRELRRRALSFGVKIWYLKYPKRDMNRLHCGRFLFLAARGKMGTIKVAAAAAAAGGGEARASRDKYFLP